MRHKLDVNEKYRLFTQYPVLIYTVLCNHKTGRLFRRPVKNQDGFLPSIFSTLSISSCGLNGLAM